MLPPVEKTAILVLKWSVKALQSDVIPMVKKELEKGEIVLLANPANDILLLTARQGTLEKQAEKDVLFKERKLSSGEIIMDNFKIVNKAQFCNVTNDGKDDSLSDRSNNRDSFGLFSIHERIALMEGLLDDLVISDPKLRSILNEKASGVENLNLRYLLQSHGWVEILTPLHNDEIKEKILQRTFWPLHRITPPVHDIEEYYGPAIAYYFAFMGFLGRSLIILGVPGLATHLWGLYRRDSIDEDEYTPFYGLFCFLWGIIVVRMWEREENTLAYRWGTLTLSGGPGDVGEESFAVDIGAVHVRPEFTGTLRLSPITGKPELHFPHYRRNLRYALSVCITGMMLFLAFCIMVLSLNLQGYIHPVYERFHPFYFPKLSALAKKGAVFDVTSSWRPFIPTILHAVCIFTLNNLYRLVSKKLTDWENHMTLNAYNRSLILKRFMFEAFDCYIVLFYLAFYECDVVKLRSELVTLFNIDSIRRLFTEVVLPRLIHWRDVRLHSDHPSDLNLDEYESFDDYMEILIQFGYVTLFASAYPLASFVMGFAVWLEIRSDCYKLSRVCQKPPDERVSSIGMWKALLNGMVWFSCLTNCLIFGLTSEQMMQYLPDLYVRNEAGENLLIHDRGWLAILVIFTIERVLLYTGMVVTQMISIVPEELSTKIRRRLYLLKLAGEQVTDDAKKEE